MRRLTTAGGATQLNRAQRAHDVHETRDIPRDIPFFAPTARFLRNAGRERAPRHALQRATQEATQGASRHAALALLCTLPFTASLAAESSPSLVLTADLNRDGVAEIITASDNQLTITDGLTATQLVRFHGEAPGDRFGSVALVLPDANGDGEPELLVAAPNAFAGAGAVYLFQSPWVSPCSDVVSAARADVVLRVPDADPSASDFGGAMRAMFDVDGDDLGEVRISARTINAQGEPSVRVYIFSTSRAEVLVQFDPILAAPNIPEVKGDVDADAEVTNADLAVILENFALLVPTRESGDLDGDGVVGLTDLAEVITEFGRRGYEAIAPPPHATNSVLCDLGTAGVAWVTPRASARMRLLIVETPGAEELVIEALPIPGYFPPDFYLYGDALTMVACAQNDARVQQALRRIARSCPLGSRLINVTFHVGCLPNGTLNGTTDGATRFSCCDRTSVPIIEVMVCANASDVCGVFAHELTHAAQYCEYGVFSGEYPCEIYRVMVGDLRDHLCRELEAHHISGLCDGDPTSNHAACCELICRAYARDRWGWRGTEDCPNSCVDCCAEWGEACCVNGRWSCATVDTCPNFPN